MKKRFIPITLALVMLLAFIPFTPAAVASGEYTAQLRGQMDMDVSDSVSEWGIQDIPEANITFDLGKPATISMTFDEPVKFSGNWTGLRTNVKADSDFAAEAIGGRIISFVVDGVDLGSRPVPLIDHDGEGEIAFDIARQWGGDWDEYDLAGMDPFTTLEITFVVGEHTATLMGQLDTDVSTSVDEWGIGDLEDATVAFEVGKEATISMSFAEAIKFTGNWTGIATSIPVRSDEDAEETGAHITKFIVDGNDLGSKLVPLINRDDSGFMTIDIARQWGGDYDEYDLAGMDPFKTLEISFIVPNVPGGEGEIGLPVLPTGGHVWIAGTVQYAGRTDDEAPDATEWYEFGGLEGKNIPFEFGVPFTVTLDLGSETATHGEASWGGYIICVETDVNINPDFYEAFIDKIVVDGNEVPFNPEGVEVGKDRGIRVPLTSGWAEIPVLDNHTRIGTFSKLEVTLVIAEYGTMENPFTGGAAAPEPTPAPPPPDVTPIERPEPTPEKNEGGLPGWVIPVIIGGVAAIAVVVVLVVVKGKKKES